MADGTDKSELEQVASLLQVNGVEYVVIGGQAETLHGSPRVTYDIDLCYRRTRENMAKLAFALQPLHPTLRGAPPGLPFHMDARTLEMGLNFNLSTSLIDLDLLGEVEPLGTFDVVRKNAVLYTVLDLSLWTISLDDLLRVKEHINRPKDQESILQLRAIKRLRDDPSPP